MDVPLHTSPSKPHQKYPTFNLVSRFETVKSDTGTPAPTRILSNTPTIHPDTQIVAKKHSRQWSTSRRAKNGSTSPRSSSKPARPPYVTHGLYSPWTKERKANHLAQTRITTKYSIKPTPQQQSADATPAAAAAEPAKPRGVLVLKTYDPVSGVTLKYRTHKAAEVSRLVHASLGRLGRNMAAVPVVEEVEMADAGEDAKVKVEDVKEQQPKVPQAGGGQQGGGKKKKKGKK